MDLNRVLILIILLGALYALYRYQQYVFNKETKNKVKSKKKKKLIKNNKFKGKQVEKKALFNDNVSISNVSQLSVGSMGDIDIKTEEINNYEKDNTQNKNNLLKQKKKVLDRSRKQHDTIDTNGSFDFLDDRTNQVQGQYGQEQYGQGQHAQEQYAEEDGIFF